MMVLHNKGTQTGRKATTAHTWAEMEYITMNEKHIIAILNLFADNESMVKFYAKEDNKPQRDKYAMMNYTIGQCLSVLMDCEVSAYQTTEYKRGDTVTAIQIYRHVDVSETEILYTYYPAFELLVKGE